MDRPLANNTRQIAPCRCSFSFVIVAGTTYSFPLGSFMFVKVKSKKNKKDDIVNIAVKSTSGLSSMSINRHQQLHLLKGGKV